MKKLFLISFVCLTLLYANDKTSFYIVAHQDDWQLFVGDYAYNDIIDDDTETVFIYITAGEASRDSTFWLAREKAALESVKFIQKAKFDTVPTDSYYDTINSHRIKCYKINDIKNYFIRLPDQVLPNLDKVSELTTVDNQNSFTYSGLKTTISSILTNYANNKIQIITHEPAEKLNPLSNDDHRLIGRMMLDINNEINSTLLLFKDYTTQNLSPNLKHHAMLQKSSTFLAYDKKMYDESGHYTNGESHLYTMAFSYIYQ